MANAARVRCRARRSIEVLATTRLFFGTEAIEYRPATRHAIRRDAGIKEYPTPTMVGMLNRLLSAPFAFVLTQSFTFLTKAAGQGLLQRQYNRMVERRRLRGHPGGGTEGRARCADQQRVRHGRPSLHAAGAGRHAAQAMRMPASRRMRALNDHVALARALLADTGMIVAREDLALEAAFWAQLPGYFSMRPRKAPITSRNFAALAPFHNYPLGRAHGNHWGDALDAADHQRALAVLLLAACERSARSGRRQPQGHRAHLHLRADRVRQDGVHRVSGRDAGAPGRDAGASSTRIGGSRFWCGRWAGTYLPLKNGEPTGFNPLQLPPTPTQRRVSEGWLRVLVRGRGDALSVREEADLDQALRGTLALEPSARRLSRLIEFTDATASGRHPCAARALV